MLIIQELTSTPKRKEVKKEKSFVIVNDDDSGYYVGNLISLMKSLGLIEQDSRFGAKRANRIETLDAIVVGDSTSVFDYDFRVVDYDDLQELDELDGRSFHVYSVVEDYAKIRRRIEEYTDANYGVACQQKSKSYFKRNKKRTAPKQEIHIEVKLEKEQQPTFLKKNVSSFRRVDPIRTTEKCTFFEDWVKIGMHQFDIEFDTFGNEFIRDVANNKYYISEDRYGRRFLVTK